MNRIDSLAVCVTLCHFLCLAMNTPQMAKFISVSYSGFCCFFFPIAQVYLSKSLILYQECVQRERAWTACWRGVQRLGISAVVFGTLQCCASVNLTPAPVCSHPCSAVVPSGSSLWEVGAGWHTTTVPLFIPRWVISWKIRITLDTNNSLPLQLVFTLVTERALHTDKIYLCN